MAHQLTLRPARDQDWTMIRRWLRQPEVERWLGPLTASEAEVIAALTSPGAIARIIELDARSVGYAHAIDAATWGPDLPDGVPPGSWDLDLFIAERDARGHGIGPQALDALREEVFTTTLATAVTVFAPITNEAAVRAYERAGFLWQRIWHDPAGGPMWLLMSERPAH
jgi:ribosomal protein S18 acetylase RimI-like enzyme